MRLSFNIEYRTNWEEEVRICSSATEFGNDITQRAIALTSQDGIHWSANLDIAQPPKLQINYFYAIWHNGEEIRREWNGIHRSIYFTKGSTKSYIIKDNWKDIPEEQYFYTSAFTNSLLAHHHRSDRPQSFSKGILLKVNAARIPENYCIGICGNQKGLGDWNADNAVMMTDFNFPEWEVELDASAIKFPLEYKFILVDKKQKKFIAWESNPNRYMADPELEDNQTIIISDRFTYFNMPTWKGAGVAVPVFSLKSESSFGVGDFGDLKKLISWAACTNQKIIQLLPVNDTTMTHTWTDSYPYSSISIYALHPMYLDLNQLPALKDRKTADLFNKKRQKLNALPAVDYEAVNNTKKEYIKLLFQQEGKRVLVSKKFKIFFNANKEWLKPYTTFCYLRNLYKTPNFNKWPEHSKFDKEEIEVICDPGQPAYSEISINYYIQFNLHEQLLEASDYAHQHGVVLKGDIPIGISRNSVEAWKEPYYFNLNGQAGAPPDDFSATGQNWIFPTYNWEAMEKDKYNWWMKRFQKMSNYFDAYRIDHILGFFRIWEIPMNSIQGLLGQFSPSLPMSREEIEGYGLHFRDEFLEPYIHEYFLEQVFGPNKKYVKDTFLEETGQYEVYRMRPKFDTQRKVEAFFAEKTDSNSIWMRDGLYSLISDVLFIRDKKDPEKFHPRIAVQHDFIYQSLNDWEKNAFNRLYDDYYYHRHNEFWREQAMKKLPQLIQSTRMLVCGEDLGMIPDCVPWVMNDLKILSLEVQRMPKDSSHEFGCLNEYPYRSVCTFSTHDMSTIRGWWEENYQTTQHYFNNMMGHYGAAPTTATPELCEEIVRNNLYSNSILCIISLQDWLSIDEKWRNPDVQGERINIPADSRHYWKYRMHITLEQLMKAERLNEKIKRLIEQTGRDPR